MLLIPPVTYTSPVISKISKRLCRYIFVLMFLMILGMKKQVKKKIG